VTDLREAAALRRRYALRSVLGRVGLYAAAVLCGVISAGPFVWSSITATKLNADLYNPDNNPFAYNQPPTFDHVKFLFTDTHFPTFAWNTLWVGLLVVVITLGLGMPAAYSLARLNLRWSGRWGSASSSST
jgi:multiple sugar transport system permease protein